MSAINGVPRPGIPYIADGYEESGYLREEARLYPAVRFRYRPLLTEERNRLLAENAKLPAGGATRNTAKVLALKVRSWSLTDAAGEPLPVTVETVLRLRPALYERLLGVVFGYHSCDEDPEAKATSEEKEQSLADQLAADEQGITVGDAREERDAKN